MIFWIAMAVLTAAVTAALLAPLFRSRAVVGEAESEVAIYRDQLGEIERDVERGVLPENEANNARAEIARRLLQASEAAKQGTVEEPRRRRGAFLVAVIVVPVVVLAGYLVLGDPGAEDMPFSERATNPVAGDLYARVTNFFTAPTQAEAAELASLIDDALAENPNDIGLLEAATLIYLLGGRFDDSIAAYDRYIAVTGVQGDPGGMIALQLAQMIILAENGVSPRGEAVLQRVLAADPANPEARLFLAVAMKDRGETDAAAAALLTLLADEPPGGAPWADFARAELQDLGVVAPPTPEGGEPADPTAQFTPEQLAQINEMVNGLAMRLAAEPNDVDGWAQLIRSYIVLARDTDARDALAAAREVFTGNAEALATIEEAAAPLLREEE